MQPLFLILDIVRDPQPVEPVLTDVVQVYDLDWVKYKWLR